MTGLDDGVISAVALDRVHPLRELYRKEMDAQIVHDSWHARGFTDLYGFGYGGELIGYAAVGGATLEPRHTVKELFLLPEWRSLEIELFDRVVGLSGARTIEAQTNDRLLLRMFFDRASHWHVTHVLFADARTTDHPAPEGVVLRQMTDADRATVFTHTYEP